MIKILIVEDEISISNLIEMNLTAADYNCTCSFNGLDATEKIDSNPFDLILLDIMLPEVNGLELLEYIRPLNIPVIFITAMSSTEDKVRGLHLGADDYIAKPFEVVELLARVESVLRRYNKSEKKLTIHDVSIDTESRVVSQNGKTIYLTIKEYNLLLLFIRNKNIALFREVIYERVWECSYIGDTRTVDLHVQRLRKKLNWTNKIKSVHKVGYRLEV